MPTPEERARESIDAQFQAAGWLVQDRSRLNLGAAPGVAVREFPLTTGFADYLLFVDRRAVGVVEAKAAGTTLSGVAEQSGAYLAGLPANVPHVRLPLPFAYESTGVETFFRDERDPRPRAAGSFRSTGPRRWPNGRQKTTPSALAWRRCRPWTPAGCGTPRSRRSRTWSSRSPRTAPGP